MPSKSSKSLIYEHVCLLNHQKTHQTLIFCSLPPKKRWYPIYPYIPVNTRKYPTYPEIPENTRHTRKYPRVKKIPGNTRSYISTLLPDPTRPATRYFVQYPTRPDIEKPYPLGPGHTGMAFKTSLPGHYLRLSFLEWLLSCWMAF